MIFRRLLLVLALAGVLAGALAALQRPLPGPAVEMAVGYTAARRFATRQGYDLERLLAEYRQAGTTSLLIGETTLFDLTNQQQLGYSGYPLNVSVRSGGEVLARRTLEGASPAVAYQTDYTYVFVHGNPALAAWLEAALRARLGAARVRGLPGDAPGQAAIELAAFKGATPDADLMLLPLGVFPPDLQVAERSGLRVVYSLSQRPRDKSGPVFRTADVAAAATLPAAAPGALVWVNGDEVPGYPGREAELAAALAGQGARLAVFRDVSPTGRRPFALGLPAVAAAMDYSAVKAFPVTYRETAADALAAIRERGVRLVLFEPAALSPDAEADVKELTSKVRAVAAGLAHSRLGPGPAVAGAPYAAPAWAVALMALAAAAAVVELGFRFRAPGPGAGAAATALTGLSAAAVAAAPALALWGPAAARPALAVAGGVALAALGAITAAALTPDVNRQAAAAAGGPADLRPAGDWLQAVRLVLRLFLYALAGGLLVRGLLAHDRFWLGLVAPPGGGLVLSGPSLLFAAYWLWQRRDTLLGEARGSLEAVVRMGPLALVLGAAAALAVLALRTLPLPTPAPGAFVAIPAEPGALGTLARRLLTALPGALEVLVGYPAVFAAVYVQRRGHRIAGLLWLTPGALAGAAVVSALLQVHMPVRVALLRAAHGLWLGVLAGTVALLLLHAVRFLGARAPAARRT